MTVDQISTQIVDAITKYSPQALGVAKAVERVNSIDWILTDLALIAAGAFIAALGWRLWDFAKKCDDEDPAHICGAIVIIIGLGFAIFTTAHLASSAWAFVGLFDPGLALAHQAMQKVLGQ